MIQFFDDVDPLAALRRMWWRNQHTRPAMIIVSQDVFDRLQQKSWDRCAFTGEVPRNLELRFKLVPIRSDFSQSRYCIRFLDSEEMTSFMSTCEPAEMIS